MKAGPRRLEAASGRPPPLRVPVLLGPVLDPQTALMEWMPLDTMKSIARHIPESEAETGWTGLPLIAEAMARGLAFAHNGIAEADHPSVIRAHLKMRDWIRDTMDSAHREMIFGDFRRLYEEALIRHSAPAVQQAVEEVPAAVDLGLRVLGSRDGDLDLSRIDRRGMFRLGQILGMGALQVNLSALLYGTQVGLFPESAFDLTPGLKAQAQRLGPRPGQDFELVDAGAFEMLRGLEDIRQGIENDWGSIHPLVRGFGQGNEGNPWMRVQGVERIRRAVEEVEDFVTRPRH